MSKIRWWESARNLGFAGTIAAGVVVAAVVGIFGVVPFTGMAVAIWHGLVYRVPVPAVILVALIVLLMMAGVGVLKRAAVPLPPPWLNYRQDTFLGVVWRWNYNGHTIIRSSLTPYCPRCSTGLRVDLGGYRPLRGYGPTDTTFICDECDFVQKVSGDGEAVISRICRLVEREATLKYANTG